MIRAHLFVYGFQNQINWGLWDFAALPSAGDIVSVGLREASTHTLTVRQVEHQPCPSPELAEVMGRDVFEPATIVVTDWKAEFKVD